MAMNRGKDVRRRLESALQAIEDLDRDLADGRLPADEHGRLRAEQEREAGRRLAELRLGDGRGGHQQAPDDPARPGGWSTRLRRPLPILGVGGLLLVGGVAGGVAAGRGLGPGRPVTGAMAAPLVASRIDLQALLPTTVAESTPIAGLLESAHGALDQGRLDEARSIYTRVLAREPRNVEAITHLGAALYQEQRVDEAVASVDEALRIDPTYIRAHWDRVQYLFYGKQDYAAAARAAEAFLQVAPRGPDADTMRALIAQARERGARSGGAPRPPDARIPAGGARSD